MTTWAELMPEPAIVTALEHAGERPPHNGSQDDKRGWSERFADGCAIAVADQLRRHPVLSHKRILPRDLGSGTEPLTPLGTRAEKRIDVTVADAVMGLEIGISLKGLNFKDARAKNYDKNLTGRLYELADEVRLVHEHLPHAFMVGIFFLPLESTIDKRSDDSESSFARTLVKLRERTGRLDVALHSHAARCDAGYVGLYVIGEEGDQFARGVCRFMSVYTNPPRRGRPRVEATMSLEEVVNDIVKRATESVDVQWGEAEGD